MGDCMCGGKCGSAASNPAATAPAGNDVGTATAKIEGFLHQLMGACPIWVVLVAGGLVLLEQQKGRR